MRGFELGAQQDEALDQEFETRLHALRTALDGCLDETGRARLLKQIAELKINYQEQTRRLEKLRVVC